MEKFEAMVEIKSAAKKLNLYLSTLLLVTECESTIISKV